MMGVLGGGGAGEKRKGEIGRGQSIITTQSAAAAAACQRDTHRQAAGTHCRPCLDNIAISAHVHRAVTILIVLAIISIIGIIRIITTCQAVRPLQPRLRHGSGGRCCCHGAARGWLLLLRVC